MVKNSRRRCRRRRATRSIKVTSASALTPRALHTIQTKGQPCLRGVNKIYVSRSSAVVSLPIPFSPPQGITMLSQVLTQQLMHTKPHTLARVVAHNSMYPLYYIIVLGRNEFQGERIYFIKEITTFSVPFEFPSTLQIILCK